MKRCGSTPTWEITNKGVKSLCLPSDACAEHEFGIKGIKTLFGVNTSPLLFGVDRRKASCVPTVHFQQSEDVIAALLVGIQPPKNNNILTNLPLCFAGFNRPDLAGAWDEESFGIVACGKKQIYYLTQLHTAILAMDIAFILRSNLFGGALNIVIASRIPNHERVWLENADRAYAEA